MSNQKENPKIDSLDRRVSKMEFSMEEVVIPTLNKLDKFIDDNKRGITTASALDSKIITAVLGAIVLAGIYVMAKGGASL